MNALMTPTKEEYMYNPFALIVFKILMKIQNRFTDNEILNRYYKDISEV